MDFIGTLQAFSAKIKKQKDNIQTQEATKTALIGALGYDIFEPAFVEPLQRSQVRISPTYLHRVSPPL